MRGISMSSSTRSGSASGQLLDRVEAILRGHHFHVVALEHAAGDLAHGDRVVDHHDQRDGGALPAPATRRDHHRRRIEQGLGATSSRRARWRRTSGATSRITTTRPSPMMVAPKMPGTELTCGPTGLTTISRLPSTWSTRIAARRSPERASSSGIWASSPSRGRRMAEQHAEVVDHVVLAGVAEDSGAAASAGARDPRAGCARRPAPTRSAPRNLVSPICTKTAWVTASVNGRRMVNSVPWPRWLSIDSEPPSWRISLQTTSMPTPRPARLG